MAEETPVVLTPGSPAPSFSLPGRSGSVVSLGDFAGKSIVLVYFYPKDDTPGCTKEACSLRDSWSALKEAGVVVLGVSRDDEESHNAFASKYSLPFELVTDADHSVHVAYGAWGQNPNPIWGVGPLRKSFLVGKDGRILHVFDKVDTEHHAEQVLKALGVQTPASAPAQVGQAFHEMVDAAKKVVEEVRKTPTVRKAASAVAKAETAVANAVEEVSQKPAVQSAAKAVRKAVADARQKPAVKKAAKAARKAVADVKAGVKKMKKAIAGARKRSQAKAKPPARKAARKAARKPARKPVKKAVKKVVKKAVRKPVKKAVKRAAPKRKTAKAPKRRR